MPSPLRPNAGLPWTPEDEATLRRLAEAGEAPRRIAECLGRSLASVSRRAEKLEASLNGRASTLERKGGGRGGTEDPPPS